MKEYDEKLLLKKLKHGINSKTQLASAKHYLQGQIHKALSNFHRSGNEVFQVREQITLGEILLEKGLVEQGFRQLDLAIAVARDHELVELLLDAQRVKLLRLVNLGLQKPVQAEGLDLIQASRAIVEDLGPGLDLHEQMLRMYEVIMEKGLAEQPLPPGSLDPKFWEERIEAARLFRDQLNTAMLAQWVFSAYRRPDLALQFLKRIRALFQAAPNWRIRKFTVYSSSMYSLAVNHLQQQSFAEVHRIYRELETFQVELRRHSDRSNVRLAELRVLSLERLLRFFGNPEYGEDRPLSEITFSPETERNLEYEYLLSIRSLDIAILFMGKEYRAADRLIQKSLNNYPSNFRKVGKLRMRLVGILIHFARAEYDLAEQELGNLRYHLKQFAGEQGFIGPYLALLHQMNSQAEPRELIVDYLAENRSESQLNPYQQAFRMIFDRMLQSLL